MEGAPPRAPQATCSTAATCAPSGVLPPTLTNLLVLPNTRTQRRRTPAAAKAPAGPSVPAAAKAPAGMMAQRTPTPSSIAGAVDAEAKAAAGAGEKPPAELNRIGWGCVLSKISVAYNYLQNRMGLGAIPVDGNTDTGALKVFMSDNSVDGRLSAEVHGLCCSQVASIVPPHNVQEEDTWAVPTDSVLSQVAVDSTKVLLPEDGDRGPRMASMTIGEMFKTSHRTETMVEAIETVPVQVAKALAPCQKNVQIALFSDSTMALGSSDRNAPTLDLQTLEKASGRNLAFHSMHSALGLQEIVTGVALYRLQQLGTDDRFAHLNNKTINRQTREHLIELACDAADEQSSADSVTANHVVVIVWSNNDCTRRALGSGMTRTDGVCRALPQSTIEAVINLGKLSKVFGGVVVMGPGEAKCWGISAEFDHRTRDVRTLLTRVGIPLINIPQYSSLWKHGSDKYHFSNCAGNRSALASIIHSVINVYIDTMAVRTAWGLLPYETIVSDEATIGRLDVYTQALATENYFRQKTVAEYSQQCHQLSLAHDAAQAVIEQQRSVFTEMATRLAGGNPPAEMVAPAAGKYQTQLLPEHKAATRTFGDAAVQAITSGWKRVLHNSDGTLKEGQPTPDCIQTAPTVTAAAQAPAGAADPAPARTWADLPGNYRSTDFEDDIIPDQDPNNVHEPHEMEGVLPPWYPNGVYMVTGTVTSSAGHTIVCRQKGN